jgi:transposase-like protein
MTSTRKTYSPKVKFQAIMELLKGEKTTTQIARAWGVHPTSVTNWKKNFLEKGPEIFSQAGTSREYEKKIKELENIIGKQTIEIALLKKFLGAWDSLSKTR